MDRLKGKTILISGGARGQGAAEACWFVAEAARIVIGDVLEAEGRQLASELGPSAVFVRQDVTQESDWATAVNTAYKLGGLHGLVNNAGIYQPRPLMETDAELFERHTRVNQLGCLSQPEQSARLIVDRGFVEGYDDALQTLNDNPYGQWREYDAVDSVRFYALRLHELGMIKRDPKRILAEGTDFRFLDELKRELKG